MRHRVADTPKHATRQASREMQGERGGGRQQRCGYLLKDLIGEQQQIFRLVGPHVEVERVQLRQLRVFCLGPVERLERCLALEAARDKTNEVQSERELRGSMAAELQAGSGSSRQTALNTQPAMSLRDKGIAGAVALLTWR